MTQAQYRVLLILTLVNTVVLLIVTVFSGYTFYVVHHTVEALQDIGRAWKAVG